MNDRSTGQPSFGHYGRQRNLNAMDHTTAAMMLTRQILNALALMSLLVGVAPIAWGQIRVKWCITALMGFIMFGGTAAIIGVALPVAAPDLAPEPAARRTEIDWTKTGLLVLAIAGCIAAYFAAIHLNDVRVRRRAAALKRTEDKARALDPAMVARGVLPDLAAPIDEALTRIRRLEGLAGRIGRADDAEALALAQRRVPSIMQLYVDASEAATDDERRELARKALSSVIEIGRVAEEARERIVRDLSDGLDTETRYISSRAEDYGLTAN